MLSNWHLRNTELVFNSGISEAYDEALKALAVSLEEHLPAGARARVLAVTSTLPGEGKSVTVANLARCLAEAGHKVLVVDADLRHPDLHRVFGQPQSNQGLAEVLLERLFPHEAVFHLEKLDLVRAGKARLKNSSALLKRNLGPALEAWREQYDYILLDLPPLALFADVAYAAKQTDGVLFLANLSRVSREVLGLGLQQLTSVRVPLTGVVSISARAGLPAAQRYLLAGPGGAS